MSTILVVVAYAKGEVEVEVEIGVPKGAVVSQPACVQQETVVPAANK